MRWILFLIISMSSACTVENSCDAYVEYMCDCHAQDTGFDCSEYELVYADADPDQQIACEVALDEQVDADAEADVDCEP